LRQADAALTAHDWGVRLSEVDQVPAGTRDDSPQERARVLGDIQDILAAVLRVPRLWAAVALVVGLASTITIARDAQGDYGFEFRVTWITAAAFALVWLPALLRVTSLVGGGVKASGSGVEASTGGLASLLGSLSPSSKREVLPSVIAALDTPDVEGQAEVRELRTALEGELAEVSSEDVSAALDGLAVRYDELRETQAPGDERTFLMTRIVAQARAAAFSLRLAEDEARRYFATGVDGKRIVGLAIIQARPSAVVLDIVLSAIEESRSAFEQFHALRALDALLPHLAPMQKKKARDALEAQRSPDGWISSEDPSRWDYSAYLLEELDK
jgi:hypothetical protein